MTLWYVGQTGIAMEVVGAALGVWFAWQTKRQWERTPAQATYDSIGDDLGRPRLDICNVAVRPHFWLTTATDPVTGTEETARGGARPASNL